MGIWKTEEKRVKQITILDWEKKKRLEKRRKIMKNEGAEKEMQKVLM